MITYMEQALDEAEKAAARGEVPVGALIVSDKGEVLAINSNRTEAEYDPTAHAEMLVIREAAHKRHSWRLIDCDLYVTLEPCTMCTAAISFARIRRVIYGASDPKGGGVDHGARFFSQNTCHHKPEVIRDVLSERSSHMLKNFFAHKRQKTKNEDSL